MPFLSYAQNFEDVLLWRALRHVHSGVYIDIGGQDPVRDSVSKAFALRGWTGVHVEATPFYANALRRDRSGDKIIEAAVGTSAQPITLYFIPGTGLSTGIKSIADEHRANGYDVDPIQVEVIPLSQILDALPVDGVHWLKIDVEGMEADVIASWGESKVRPWILVIESTYPNTQKPTHIQWIDAIHSLGYQEVYFDGLSRYFVSEAHADLASAFTTPPNIFDAFSVTPHHFSAQEIARENHERLAQLEDAAGDIETSRLQTEATNAALTNENSVLHNKLRAVTDEIDAYRTRLEAADQRLEDVFRDLGESNASWMKRVTELDGRAAQLSAEGEAHRHKSLILSEMLATERRRLDEAFGDFQQRIEILTAEKDRASIILEERTAFWNERRKDFNERLRSADAATAVVNGRLQDARDALLQNERDAAAQIADRTGKMLVLEQALDEAQSGRAALQQRLADLQDVHAKQLDHCHQELRDRDFQLNEVRVQAHELADILATRDHEIGELNSGLACIIAERDDRNREVGEYRRHLSDLQASFNDEQARNDLLTQKQSGLIQMLDELSIEIAQTKEWRRQLQVAIADEGQSTIWQDLRARLAGSRLSGLAAISSDITAWQCGERPLAEFEPESGWKGKPLIVEDMTEQVTPVQSVEDICRFTGPAFVSCAYISILGRLPDDIGMAYYMDRIRNGWSKSSVLVQMALSDEGRSRQAQISGLKSILKRHRRLNFPLFGRFVRKTDEDRNSAVDRSMRRFENSARDISDRLQYFNVKIENQEHRVNEISNKIGNILGVSNNIKEESYINSASISFGNEKSIEIIEKIDMLIQQNQSIMSNALEIDMISDKGKSNIISVEDILSIVG